MLCVRVSLCVCTCRGTGHRLLCWLLCWLRLPKRLPGHPGASVLPMGSAAPSGLMVNSSQPALGGLRALRGSLGLGLWARGQASNLTENPLTFFPAHDTHIAQLRPRIDDVPDATHREGCVCQPVGDNDSACPVTQAVLIQLLAVPPHSRMQRLHQQGSQAGLQDRSLCSEGFATLLDLLGEETQKCSFSP